MSTGGRLGFRARARVEADRYGPDPWVFVRELLQNGRDAGAAHIAFHVEESAGRVRLRCRDDGEGMSFEHARRYLFSLYASSKEGSRNQVGRFGVGFWSILRFEPTRICIRSRPSRGPAWEVVLDGELTQAQRRPTDMERGTEILLERSGDDVAVEGRLAARVFDAARQNGRFLCRRDAPEVPLVVEVDGRLVNAAFELPAPSAHFTRRHVHGVVGLGAAPRVELFSRGLRVRSAACLDDLLLDSGHTAHSRVRFPELPDAVAPQALLECATLEPLLSRTDARDTRALRRLVRLAHDELRHLVEQQLDRVHPPGTWERLAALARRVRPQSTLARSLAGASIGGLLALGIARLAWPERGRVIVDAPTIEIPADGNAPVATAPSNLYGNLARDYHGPQVSELDPDTASAMALRYSPASEHPYLAALLIDRPGVDRAGVELDPAPYRGESCAQDCLQLALDFAAGPGPLIVPLPTGHALEVGSVRVDGEPATVAGSSLGEPVITLASAHTGRLSYRTGPARRRAAAPPLHSDATLPAELRAEARALTDLALETRVAAAIDLVRGRVRYSTDADTSAQHRRALAAGEPFATRALRIGAGDCDVLNGLLVPILHEAKVPARLAIGLVGTNGAASPWLHAWVEFLDERGRWRVADATTSADGEAVAVARPPAPPGAIVGDTGPAASSSATHAPLAGDAVNDADLVGARPEHLESVPESSTRADPTVAASRSPSAESRFLPGTRARTVSLGTALAMLVALAVALVFVRRRRVRRSLHIDDASDLSSLLRGALQQPAAFRSLPALFHRQIVPLRDGRRTSLVRAREAAGAGKLYAGRETTALSRTAVARRVPVLDLERPEGRAVATTLGATDLDDWGSLLARAEITPILAHVNEAARRGGEAWRVRAAAQLGREITTLDLDGLAEADDQRIVLLDVEHSWLTRATADQAEHPATALFALLDHLTDHLGLDARRKARFLHAHAAAAMLEIATRVAVKREGA